MNREGRTFKHIKSGAIVLVIKSKRMSAGTTRHTVLVIDSEVKGRPVGSQTDVDEVPVRVFNEDWEAI